LFFPLVFLWWLAIYGKIKSKCGLGYRILLATECAQILAGSMAPPVNGFIFTIFLSFLIFFSTTFIIFSDGFSKILRKLS
jgi:hypothetical protein